MALIRRQGAKGGEKARDGACNWQRLRQQQRNAMQCNVCTTTTTVSPLLPCRQLVRFFSQSKKIINKLLRGGAEEISIQFRKKRERNAQNFSLPAPSQALSHSLTSAAQKFKLFTIWREKETRYFYLLQSPFFFSPLS